MNDDDVHTISGENSALLVLVSATATVTVSDDHDVDKPSV